MEVSSHLEYKVVDNIGIISLADPKGYNFFNWELIDDLGRLQADIEADKSLRAVIIQTSGKHFSAGIHFSSLGILNSQLVMEKLSQNQRIYSFWQDLGIPVIAAVNGVCFGIATELILACDIRIAAEDSQFAIQEVRFGLSPDHGGTTRLTHLVGIGQAKRMIMNCEQIKADEALRIGLVEVVVKPEEVQDYAFNMAKNMSGFPPAGLRFAKHGINLASESSVAAGLYFERAQATYCCGTEDQKEAMQAFIEKRPPVFKNR